MQNYFVSQIKGVIKLVILERTTPLALLQEEALLRRLIKNHEKTPKIKENLEKAKAGLRGEENLDYYLSLLPKNYLIFKGLRLIHDNHVFQLDALILSLYFGMIVEAKNMAGTLTFENFNQMIRKKDEKEEGFLDPIAQAKRQLILLQGFLQYHKKTKPLPLDFLIAISHPSTILKTTVKRQDVTEKVMHAIHIPEKIRELEKRFTEPSLSPYYLQKISQLLVDHHTPLTLDILNHYSISQKEILKGVLCPTCKTIPMVRKKAKWFCPQCQIQSKTAHHQAINDYFLLISPTITNQQCREFLQISSKDIAYKLLHSMNLPYTGSGKGRVYHQIRTAPGCP